MTTFTGPVTYPAARGLRVTPDLVLRTGRRRWWWRWRWRWKYDGGGGGGTAKVVVVAVVVMVEVVVVGVSVTPGRTVVDPEVMRRRGVTAFLLRARRVG